jgi:hypothetical protein
VRNVPVSKVQDILRSMGMPLHSNEVT